MSINIQLRGTRILTTKSGIPVVDHKTVESILQTPTQVTNAILEKETFEERLNVYCEWADQYQRDGFWCPIYEDEHDGLEFYKNYNNDDYLYDYDEDGVYKELRTQYVEKIIYPGDSGFDKLQNDEEIKCIAFAYIKDRPTKERLKLIISDLKENEYELEWYAIWTFLALKPLR